MTTLFPTLRTASPKTALRFGDRTLTHAELAATAGRLARRLIARATATARHPGDTAPVAVWATPTIETSVAVVAALLAGVIRLADRLGIPVLTLVDTPGAANDAAAERSGAGPATAEVFGTVAAARVVVTTLVVGEGGSGGALAFAAPGRTWITADAYFSVTAPEAAAAILKRGPDDVAATADQLRLRPQDVVALGIAESLAARARRG